MLNTLNYKQLTVIPIILFILSAVYLFTIKDNLNLDIDLKGGTQISLDSSEQLDTAKLQTLLSKYDANVRSARSASSHTTVIEVGSEENAVEIVNEVTKAGYAFSGYSVQSVGSSLGASFFQQAQIAMALAFIFMAVTVFIIFRIPAPSFYVILAAAADIVETLVTMQLLGIKLSLATFAGLLLLIGYSVDTDILLTARVLKSEGETKQKIKNAMKTGLTMTVTAIAAIGSLLIFTPASVLTQIASVLLIGLVFDVFNTWITNAGLLRCYVESKNAKAGV